MPGIERHGLAEAHLLTCESRKIEPDSLAVGVIRTGTAPCVYVVCLSKAKGLTELGSFHVIGADCYRRAERGQRKILAAEHLQGLAKSAGA